MGNRYRPLSGIRRSPSSSTLHPPPSTLHSSALRPPPFVVPIRCDISAPRRLRIAHPIARADRSCDNCSDFAPNTISRLAADLGSIRQPDHAGNGRIGPAAVL